MVRRRSMRKESASCPWFNPGVNRGIVRDASTVRRPESPCRTCSRVELRFRRLPDFHSERHSLMLFAWLKRRRRAQVVAAPFPDDWLVYLQKNVGLYSLLTEPERQKLRDDLRIFIAETTFEGCRGLKLTDEIKVTIAAQASLLLLG